VLLQPDPFSTRFVAFPTAVLSVRLAGQVAEMPTPLLVAVLLMTVPPSIAMPVPVPEVTSLPLTTPPKASIPFAQLTTTLLVTDPSTIRIPVSEPGPHTTVFPRTIAALASIPSVPVIAPARPKIRSPSKMVPSVPPILMNCIAVAKLEIVPFRTAMPRLGTCGVVPGELNSGAIAAAADRKTGEVDGDKVGVDQQAIAGGSEVADEFIRAWVTDRLAFLDPGRSFCSRVCSRASDGCEDYCSKGEHNWKKRC